MEIIGIHGDEDNFANYQKVYYGALVTALVVKNTLLLHLY